MIFKSRKTYVRHSMNAALWSIWNSAARLGIARPSAAELSLLILLGACLLALRSFRENYLKVWVLGWLGLVASRMAEHTFAGQDSGAIRSCSCSGDVCACRRPSRWSGFPAYANA